MKKPLRLALVIGVIAVLGLGISWSVQQLRSPAKTIPTTRVQRGALELDINTVGDLRTPHSAMLVAPSVNGGLQIVDLLPTGAAVKAGDVVVEFDPSEQEYNLEVNRSQMLEAEQQIVKARADASVKEAEEKVALLKARFDVRRAELDVQRNELVSQIDARKNLLVLEQARRHLTQLEQDASSRAASSASGIALLEEKRRSAQLAMQQAQNSIDSMKLKAPIGGLVSIKDNMDANGGMLFWGQSLPEYREGDVVYSGRFVAEVLDVDQMEVVAKVFESDRANLNEGQEAEIHMDAQPQTSLSARVKAIAGMASRRDFGSDTVRRFDVTFDLLNHPARMRPGTSAQILIHGHQMKDQLYLPSQCLFEKDGKMIVYVKRNGKFEATEVKVKFRTENRVSLENLPEGSEVALVDPNQTGQDQPKETPASPMGVGQ